MKLGQGRIGRGPDKRRKRVELKWRTDEGGVVSFSN